MHESEGYKEERGPEAEILHAKLQRLKARCLAADPSLAGELEWMESQVVRSGPTHDGAPESHDYLRAIVANSLDAITVFDHNGVCEYVNDAVCQLVRWPREELIGQSFMKVAPPELYEFYGQKWVGIMAGTQGPYEGEILTRYGKRRAILISGKRVTVGGKDKCFSIVKDITELKETQKALQITNENLERLVTRRTMELVETVKVRDSVIEALKESEARHRELVEDCGFVVATFSCDGRVLYANHSVSKYLGRTPDEVTGMHVLEALGADMGGKVMERLKHLVETGEAEDAIDCMITPDGPRWTWGHPSVHRDSDGKPCSVTVFLHDITESRLAEQKILESEEKYRRVIEGCGLGVAVHDTDTRLVMLNAFAEKCFNGEAEDLIGRKIADIVPGPAGQRMADLVRQVVESGLEVESEDELAYASGSKWMQSRLSPLRDADGRVNGVLVFAQDITERRLAQQQMKESEERHRILIENTGLSITWFDMQARIVILNDVSAARMMKKKEELIGRRITEVVPIPATKAMEDRIFGVLADGGPVEIEIESELPIGKRWLRARINPMKDTSGTVTGAVLVTQDITEQRQAERQARETEERYRDVIENSGIVVAGFDLQARYMLINSLGASRLKRKAEDIIGKRPTEVVSLSVTELIEDHVKEVAATGCAMEIEEEVVMPIGRRWVRVRYNPIRDAEGAVTGVILFSQDITEQKLTQLKLGESEERYQQLIETAGVSVTCFDKDLRITLANGISAARFEKSPDELAGMRINDVVGPPWGTIMEDNLRVALDTNRESELEMEIMLPVGRRWFWLRVVPLRDTEGMVTGVMVISHDITERKLAQLALQESEHRRRLLAETAMEGIFMHEDGILLEANQQYFDMFGYKPEELLGKEARARTLTPESLHAILANASAGGNKRIQVTCVRKDGTQFPCEVHGREMVYNGRKVRVAAVMDISDRVKAEAELARLQEKMAVTERLAAIGYVGANMAHEVNTPLSVMRLTIQMLASDLEKARSSKQTNIDRAATVLREIDRTAEIIRRYREMTRPAQSVDSTLEELREAPARVIEVLKSSAIKAKLRIMMGQEVPELAARLKSAEDIEQLFFILTENAIQAADGEKWCNLEITGKQVDGRVELRFADECCGIASENIGRLFDPFFSTKPRDVGTGLGLCIVKRLLQERGGQIRVESRVGQGSTFTVVYPA